MSAAEPPAVTDANAPTRGRLSVDRIVAEALDLASKEGVRGISMRPLAARFGVSATALYGHVASRDALLGLMLESVLADVPHLPEDLPWDAAMKLGALQLRDALGPYPQLALEALGGHAAAVRAETGRNELLGRLLLAGFGEEEAGLALACWGRWTLSYLAAAEHTSEANQELTDRSFEYGVELLLSGLRAQLAAAGR